MNAVTTSADQTSDAAPILVMDSGVGGLSIVDHIRKTCPGTPIFYLADNGAFPYGDKSESWLVERVVQLAKGLVAEYPIRLMVLGCNTASTVVLPALRDALPIPVVGVVPAIKPAAALSHNAHIGLLATPGTVSRSYTDQLISDHAPHCEVTRVGSTEVVRLAENKLEGLPVDLKRLQQAVAPLFETESLDTVVLGCTHFPLLLEELEQIQPRPIRWVDSGAAIARRVKLLLEELSSEPVQVRPVDASVAREPVLSADGLPAVLRPTSGQSLAFVTSPLPVDSALLRSFELFGFSSIYCLPTS